MKSEQHNWRAKTGRYANDNKVGFRIHVHLYPTIDSQDTEVPENRAWYCNDRYGHEVYELGASACTALALIQMKVFQEQDFMDEVSDVRALRDLEEQNIASLKKPPAAGSPEVLAAMAEQQRYLNQFKHYWQYHPNVDQALPYLLKRRELLQFYFPFSRDSSYPYDWILPLDSDHEWTHRAGIYGNGLRYSNLRDGWERFRNRWLRI